MTTADAEGVEWIRTSIKAAAYGSRLALSLGRDDTYSDKFFSSKFSAVDANSCMLASRSELPVSSVIAADWGPETAMQQWPAASP